MKNITTIILICLCTEAFAQCHIDDWTALKALYESTNGDNWENKEGWDQIKGDTPPPGCDLSKMHGVRLDEDYGKRVEDLVLPGNNLNGTIPPEISKLTELIDLGLVNNMLEGNIPGSIGALIKLESLRLAFNNLSGAIPAEIGNLINLGNLDLLSNNLSGSIPPELGNLKSIRKIYLLDNQLTGEIPPEFSNIEKIFNLFLNANQLTGTIPAVFGDMHFNNLTLGISSNNLSGCFDANLFKMCDSFAEAVYGFVDGVSPGNNFDATWEEFCFEGKGVCDTTNRCHLTDWQALQSIYQNYNGENWLNTTGWDSLIVNQDTIPANCNLDEFYGVATNAEGRVDSINLSGNQLSGNFNSEWLSLDSLTYLNIANNNLSGCFDSLAIELCEQLNSPYFVSDSLIDKGNNFDSSWDFFCAYQTCDTTSTSIFNFAVHQPLSLFPNPAANFIYDNVDFPLSDNLEYQIIDINGQLLKSSIIDAQKISVASLKAGTYFLIIRNGEKTYLSRFVKM